jgi:ComF family protein
MGATSRETGSCGIVCPELGLRPTTSRETGSCGIVCGACLKRAPTFGHTVAAYSYGFPVDALIHALKYGGNLALAPLLAERLTRLAAERERPDLLIPMPLHRARLRERGFNQALEIGRIVAAGLGIPLEVEACRRIRDTIGQTGLSWKERRRNVRGAFACDKDLAGRRVAVLDDVMTTGATLDELGRVLRRAGAVEVDAWVVARTPPP